MGRRYRRYRSSGRRQRANPLALLFLIAFYYLYQYWQIVLLIAIVIGGICLAWHLIRRNKSNEPTDAPDTLPESATAATDSQHQTYSSKDSLMTDCEKSYFEVIKKLVEPSYTIQPQINLASVIDKDTHARYRNELFRNIDFGIFDKNYKLLVLIEINDQSHTMQNRKERDQKVKAICAEANIPLITFWTKYGVNEAYIRNRLSEHLTICNDAPQDGPGPYINA